MTVRQTPFTATLSPDDNSFASGEATRNRKPPDVGLRSINSPVASTRPVNISLYQDIGTEWFDVRLYERGRRKRPAAEQLQPFGTDDVRRDIQTHVIDEALDPRARVHARATFEQERSDVPGGQSF